MIRFNRLSSWCQHRAAVYSKSHSRRNLYESLNELISARDVGNFNSVLNVGAGGQIDLTLREASIDFVSLDIDSSKNPDVVASMEEMSMFKDAEFDAIFCMEVLEHVRNPFRAVSEAHRVLKPGGIFVGSTPFILGIHDAPYDFFRFTRYGIELLFQDFERVTIQERNSYFESVAVLPLRLFATGTKMERKRLAIRFPLFVLTTWWLKVLGRGVHNATCATGYFFVFRRPLESRGNR